jgi:hypothetical protein
VDELGVSYVLERLAGNRDTVGIFSSLPVTDLVLMSTSIFSLSALSSAIDEISRLHTDFVTGFLTY